MFLNLQNMPMCVLVPSLVSVLHMCVHVEPEQLQLLLSSCEQRGERSAELPSCFVIAEHTEIKPVCEEESEWQASWQQAPCSTPATPNTPESPRPFNTPWKLFKHAGNFFLPLLSLEKLTLIMMLEFTLINIPFFQLYLSAQTCPSVYT